MKKLFAFSLAFLIGFGFLADINAYVPRHQVYWKTFREPVNKMPIHVRINGQIVDTQDVPFYSKNNRIFVPASFVEKYFAEVSYIDYNNGIANFDNDKLICDCDSGQITLNDVVLANDYFPYMSRNTIMIPIRTVALAYNYKVVYNSYENIVELTR